jgi:hypothetical protein
MNRLPSPRGRTRLNNETPQQEADRKRREHLRRHTEMNTVDTLKKPELKIPEGNYG